MGSDPRDWSHACAVELQAAVDAYIEAVIAHEDYVVGCDIGHELWTDEGLRHKREEQEAYERLYALSARGRDLTVQR